MVENSMLNWFKFKWPMRAYAQDTGACGEGNNITIDWQVHQLETN